MLTLTILLAVAALILGIAALAGKWAPAALPAAVILLSILALLQSIPIK